MRVISNNCIELRDGRKVQLPQSGHIKLKMSETYGGEEKIYLNGKEFKDGEFKVTFMGILQYLFG